MLVFLILFFPFVNIFILFNLTLKTKIWCCPLINFSFNCNPHSFNCYFLGFFVFFPFQIILQRFIPCRLRFMIFFMYSASSLMTHVVTLFLSPRAEDGMYLFWIKCKSLARDCWKIDKNREERKIKFEPCLSCFLLSLSFIFIAKIVRILG